MSALRNTKQRDAVLRNLSQRFDHPTADEVYLQVKKEIPAISLATVYRNLKLLESEGKIIKISTPNCDRFDGHTHQHLHFTCNNCGCVVDIESETVPDFNNFINDFNGTVNGYSLMFFGVCPTCVKNQI